MALRSASLLLLLPLLPLPALSAQAATPPVRPNLDGSALAGRPVLTAAELDALNFSSTVELTGPQDQATREELKGLSLGVWVSRRAYREGEPIPVLFAVRNRGPARDLDLRIELTTTEAAGYNGARIHLTRTDPGNAWKQRLQHIYVCGSRSLGLIERDGYHCSGGDLRALGDGRLPAGPYRLWWGYRGLKSNVVEFTVLPSRDGRPGALSRRPLAGVIELAGGKLEGLPNGAREHSLRLTGARAYVFREYQVALRLSAGVGGKYYPSLADLPGIDGGLEATARFLRRSPDALPFAVEVTLRAAPGRKDMVLARDLRVALLVEPQPGNPSAVERHWAGRGDTKDVPHHSRHLVLDRPLVLRVDLPAGWECPARLAGPARVAVLVSTERFPTTPSRLHATEDVRRVRDREAEEWRGLLRSPWLDVVLPPLPAKTP